MGAAVSVPCVDRPERTPETNPDQPPFDYPRYGRPVHIEPVSTHSQEFFSSFYDKEKPNCVNIATDSIATDSIASADSWVL